MANSLSTALKSRKQKIMEKEVLRRFRHINVDLFAKFIIDVQDALNGSKYSFVKFPCLNDVQYSNEYGLIYPSADDELNAKLNNIIYYCQMGCRDGLANIHACFLELNYLLFPCDKEEYKLSSKRIEGANPDIIAFNPLLSGIIDKLVELCIANPNMSMEEAMGNIVANIPHNVDKRKKLEQ